MDPTASWLFSASGRRTWSRSSKVTMNIFWCTRSSSASINLKSGVSWFSVVSTRSAFSRNQRLYGWAVFRR